MWCFDQLRVWFSDLTAADRRLQANRRRRGYSPCNRTLRFDLRSALLQLECLEERKLLSIASLAISSPTINQPTAGPMNLDFTVTRTGETLSTITVGYTTSDGTATAGADYVTRTGTVTIPSGSATATINIPVLHDGTNGGDQNFHVTLTGITNVVGPAASFAAHQDFTAGTSANSVATGDFNGDGKPDVVVTNDALNVVTVLSNTTAPGAAVPSFTAHLEAVTFNGPSFVVVGDWNHDGLPDLAVANSRSNDLSILLNTTAPGAAVPSFSAKQDFATGLRPTSVAGGDLNGDGLVDLVVTNSGSGSVSVLLNTTTPGATVPSFAPQQAFSAGSNPRSVAMDDVNGDGRLDLAVANGSSYVAVLLNTTAPGAATAGFAAMQDFTTGASPISVIMGDLNGDGRPDLAVANQNPGSHSVSVLLNTTAPGSPLPSFAAKQDLDVGYGPILYSVAMGDVNGDGKPDLAVADYHTSKVIVLLNATVPGATVISFSAKQDFGTSSVPSAVTLADFNGDGRPDIAAATNNNLNGVSVLLNTTTLPDPAVSLAAKQDFTTGGSPISVAVGDLNRDGKLDVVVANETSDTVSVLLNTTAPCANLATFAAKQDFSAGSNLRAITVGDLNGDGLPDLVVASQGSTSVSVLLNTTAPGALTESFAAKQDFSTGTNPAFVTLGDLNGDGKLDLAVADFAYDTVSVLLNTTAPGASTPSFAAKQDFTTGSNPRSVVVGDLNGDGLPDLAVANYRSDNVSVLLNTTAPGASTMSFADKQDFAVGNRPSSVSVGDLNGDGLPDLVTANTISGSVSVLLNTTTIGSATTSFAGKQDFTTLTGPHFVTMGDLDGDGKPDLAVAHSSSNILSVLLNTTAPGAVTATFAARQDFGTGASPFFVTIGDLNGDGRADLATANIDAASISALLNPPAVIAAAQGTGTIVLPNHAPVLDASKTPTAAAVKENAGYPSGPVGTLVSQLVDFATPSGQVDNVTDADSGAVLGIAVTSAPQTRGIWYYSLDSGGSWSFIGVLGPRATRLLAADAGTRLYFKPAANFTGTVTDALTFRAWDQATGTNGGIVNSTFNGGAASMSTAEDQIQITVTPANTAPLLDKNKSPVLNSVAMNSGNPVGAVGTLVSKLVDFAGPLTNVTDIDSGALLGIAVTAGDTAHGSWFYSVNNGSTWLALGAVSNTSARLLAADANTRLYFKPNANFKGLLPTAITFRAWDRTAGTNGGLLSTATNGGISAFSTATDTASLSIA